MTGASFAQWRGSPNHYDGRLGLSVNHITLHILVGPAIQLPGRQPLRSRRHRCRLPVGRRGERFVGRRQLALGLLRHHHRA